MPFPTLEQYKAVTPEPQPTTDAENPLTYYTHWLSDPIVDTADKVLNAVGVHGLKEGVDNFAHPKLKDTQAPKKHNYTDGGVQVEQTEAPKPNAAEKGTQAATSHLIGEDSPMVQALLKKMPNFVQNAYSTAAGTAHNMVEGLPLSKAKAKGFAVGSGEAINPLLVAQTVAPESLAVNAATAVAGAGGAFDSSKSTSSRLMDAGQAALGALHLGKAASAARSASKMASTAGAVDEAVKPITTVDGLRVRMGKPVGVADHSQLEKALKAAPEGPLAKVLGWEPQEASAVDVEKNAQSGRDWWEKETGNNFDRGKQHTPKNPEKTWAPVARSENARGKFTEKQTTQEVANLNARDKWGANQAKEVDKELTAGAKQQLADASQESRNLNAKDKWATGVSEEMDEEARKAAAKAAIASAKEGLIPTQAVTETATAPTDLGKETLTTKYVPPPDEAGEGGGSSAPKGPGKVSFNDSFDEQGRVNYSAGSLEKARAAALKHGAEAYTKVPGGYILHYPEVSPDVVPSTSSAQPTAPPAPKAAKPPKVKLSPIQQFNQAVQDSVAKAEAGAAPAQAVPTEAPVPPVAAKAPVEAPKAPFKATTRVKPAPAPPVQPEAPVEPSAQPASKALTDVQNGTGLPKPAVMPSEARMDELQKKFGGTAPAEPPPAIPEAPPVVKAEAPKEPLNTVEPSKAPKSDVPLAEDENFVFKKQPPEVNARRITPEVRRELQRMADEMDTFPYQDKTWTEVPDKSGNGGGGDHDITAGAGGAPVHQDVLGEAPLGKPRNVKGEKILSKGNYDSNTRVRAAVQKVLDSNDIHNNLGEGAVRVAEKRLAGKFSGQEGVSKPVLPHPEDLGQGASVDSDAHADSPDLTPEEAQKLMDEVARATAQQAPPIAEVPFSLEREAAQPKPVEPTLKPEAEPTPEAPKQGRVAASGLRIFKSPVDAAGAGYKDAKIAAPLDKNPLGLRQAGAALSQEAKRAGLPTKFPVKEDSLAKFLESKVSPELMGDEAGMGGAPPKAAQPPRPEEPTTTPKTDTAAQTSKAREAALAKRQAAKAAQEAEAARAAKGESQTPDQTAAASAEADEIAAKMAKMSPEERAAFLKRIKSPEGSIDPKLLLNMSLRGVGAAAGAKGGQAVGEKVNPKGNQTIPMAIGAGLGLLSPELLKLVPRGSASALEQGGAIDQGLTTLNKIHNTMLLSPMSVAKKGLGDMAALGYGAASNPDKAGAIMRELMNLKQSTADFKAGFNLSNPEELSGMENLFQKGPLSWSGRTMGGLTASTKGILQRAGLTAEEAKKLTFTNTPDTFLGKQMYKLFTGKERGAKLLQNIAPFARIGINRAERGFENSPFGAISALTATGTTARDEAALKAAIGTVIMGAAYQMTPADFIKKHPVEASLITAAMGPLGIPVAFAMAAKGARNKPMSAGMKEATRDVPGFRLMEDIQSPEAWARNYISGYTNVTRPLAEVIADVRGEAEPDTTSNRLNPIQAEFNQAGANVPGIREMLPTRRGRRRR